MAMGPILLSGSLLQPQKLEDQIEIIVVICCPESFNLVTVPRREAEAELEQKVPP